MRIAAIDWMCMHAKDTSGPHPIRTVMSVQLTCHRQTHLPPGIGPPSLFSVVCVWGGERVDSQSHHSVEKSSVP